MLWCFYYTLYLNLHCLFIAEPLWNTLCLLNRIIQSALSLSIITVMMGTAYAADSQEPSNKTNSQSTESTKLETIVVTASGFEQEVKQAAASISVLTQEDINKKAYRDITDALKDVPGVVVTGGGSSSDISIRGMGSAYTVFFD